MSEPGLAPDLAARVASTVERLRAGFASGRTRPVEWRRAQLVAIERMLAESESDIAAALASDLGRPRFEAWLGDIANTAAEAAYARKHLRAWMRPKRAAVPLALRPGRAFTRYEPLGTVLVIAPWNYPVYLALGPLVGAIAAGNTAIVKPSEHAPATSALLARLVPRYLDPDAVAVVEGDADATRELISHGLDHVFFTGGPEIGKLVMAAAAPHLTPVTLELGGKSPAVVTARADVAVAARRIAWTKFANSGQTCVAPDYVLVDSAVSGEFVDALNTSITEMLGADASLRIVDARQHERLAGLLATAAGTTVRGGRVDADGLGIEPTVIVDPDVSSELMRQEIFGPILPVLRVDSLDAAIGFVTARPKPLAAYLFSNDRAEQKRMVAEVSAGGTVINQALVQVLTPDLPFGGVGNSGMGNYHGLAGFETFSHRKAVLVKPARPDLSLIYPPYSARAEKLLRRLL